MKILPCFLTLGLFFSSTTSHAQRDPNEFTGTPWEAVEAERDAIELALESRNHAEALIHSASALYRRRTEPAFCDVSTSICRAYAGVPVEAAEDYIEFAQWRLDGQTNGLGWLTVAFAAEGAMKPETAVRAYREALKDSMCCEIPFVYSDLARNLVYEGRLDEATRTFAEAVRAASETAVPLFQIRHTFGETMRECGRLDRWREVTADCSSSALPLEKAWGLQQAALSAWSEGDGQTFAEKAERARAAASIYSETTPFSWRWMRDQWNTVDRHLHYAELALAESPVGAMILDLESAALDESRGDIQGAFDRIEPYIEQYPIEEVDAWDEDLLLWGQRLHVAYNNYLGRLGFHDEAVAGFQGMIPYARDTYHTKFEPHLYCQLGYTLMNAGRLVEAKSAFETGLSVLDVLGETVDPNLGYVREGRIGKRKRMCFVANYRWVLARLEEAGQ